MSKKEKKRIEDEFDQIKSDKSNMKVELSNKLARLEDLPDFGHLEIYDYNGDLDDCMTNAIDILESLIDLYLGDVPQLKDHPYIQNKMKEDAKIYAESLFLSKMARKNLLVQLKQVDNGDNSARMHEVINQTFGQIRENSKFSSTQKSELEKFYKNLRKDLGLDDEISTPNVQKAKEVENREKNENKEKIIDNRSLNDMIKKAMTKKDGK
jgi:hypothetical protein